MGWVTGRLADPGDRSAVMGIDYPVLVLDHRGLFSTAVTAALRGEGIEAQAVLVESVQEFISTSRLTRAGLVVLGLDGGKYVGGASINAVELIKKLRMRGWKVLVVSDGEDEVGVAAAIAAGAIGRFAKSQSFDVLLQTVLNAAAGAAIMTKAERESWLVRHRRHIGRERELSRRFVYVTQREREVLELLAAGMRAAAIAEHLIVSMPTVRTHIRAILAKLQVKSQLEAVALWRQHLDAVDRQGRRMGSPADAAECAVRAV